MDTLGSGHKEGLSLRGDTDGVPGSRRGTGLPSWAGSAATKPPAQHCSPSSSLASSLPSRAVPRQLILSPAALGGPWGKGLLPPPNPQPTLAKGRLDAGREAPRPRQDRGAKRAPIMGKTCQGSWGSPPPPSILPGGPSVLEFADARAGGARPVTLLCPRGHREPSPASTLLGRPRSPG